MNSTKHKAYIRSNIQLEGPINIAFFFFVHNYFSFCQHKAHIKLIPAGNAFLKLEQITRTHNSTKQNKATTTKKIEIRIMKRLQRTVQVNSRTNTNVLFENK